MFETDCDDVLHDLQHYIDGELDASRSARLAEHLGGCSDCLSHADFQSRLKEIVREKCGHSATPEHLLEKVRAAIRADTPVQG